MPGSVVACSWPTGRLFFLYTHHKKLKDTLKARRNFLNLCPAASQDDKMRQLVNDISNGPAVAMPLRSMRR